MTEAQVLRKLRAWTREVDSPMNGELSIRSRGHGPRDLQRPPTRRHKAPNPQPPTRPWTTLPRMAGNRRISPLAASLRRGFHAR